MKCTFCAFCMLMKYTMSIYNNICEASKRLLRWDGGWNISNQQTPERHSQLCWIYETLDCSC